MGYQFDGFFAQTDDNILTAALTYWPFCCGRHISTPFIGIGVRCPVLTLAQKDDEAEAILTQIAAVVDGLPAWSQQFPTTTFVYLHADCVGGNCLYEGYVCVAGRIYVQEDSSDQTLLASRHALQRLLTWLGVARDQEYFAPFERHFFDHSA